jgi:hypothetical protein
LQNAAVSRTDVASKAAVDNSLMLNPSESDRRCLYFYAYLGLTLECSRTHFESKGLREKFTVITA